MENVLHEVAASERLKDFLLASHQEFQILHWGLVAAPVVAGLDKFTDFLTNWDKCLAPYSLAF